MFPFPIQSHFDTLPQKFVAGSCFLLQTPFQRLVKRMTRFHTKKDLESTVRKLKVVLDRSGYNFRVNTPRQVQQATPNRCTIFCWRNEALILAINICHFCSEPRKLFFIQRHSISLFFCSIGRKIT